MHLSDGVRTVSYTHLDVYKRQLNGYAANRAEQEAAEQISGRAIDQKLIDEMRPAYEDFIFNGNYKEALPYLDVYNFIGRTLGTQAGAEILVCDSEAFYEKLNAQLDVYKRQRDLYLRL